MTWRYSLGLDLADVFSVRDYVETHLTLTASASGGNWTLSVGFFIKPLYVAVNSTTFFATNGTASWLWRCQSLHYTAAAEDMGISLVPVTDPGVPGGLGRGAASPVTVPESESALTVVVVGAGAPTNHPSLMNQTKRKVITFRSHEECVCCLWCWSQSIHIEFHGAFFFSFLCPKNIPCRTWPLIEYLFLNEWQ
jgi:hypothetical protein